MLLPLYFAPPETRVCVLIWGWILFSHFPFVNGAQGSFRFGVDSTAPRKMRGNTLFNPLMLAPNCREPAYEHDSYTCLHFLRFFVWFTSLDTTHGVLLTYMTIFGVPYTNLIYFRFRLSSHNQTKSAAIATGGRT